MFQEWLWHEQNIVGLSAKEIIGAERIIVATVEDQAVGFCTVYTPHASDSVLSALFVRPDYRGQGIGHQLFARMDIGLMASTTLFG